MIATFIDSFITIDHALISKETKILNKCQSLDFNFDILVHSMLNSLATCIIPLDIAIHISFIFLMEGVKSLFRFMYSCIKFNKRLILNLDSKKDLMGKIRENSKKNMKLSECLKYAFEIKLKTTGTGTNVKFE